MEFKQMSQNAAQFTIKNMVEEAKQYSSEEMRVALQLLKAYLKFTRTYAEYIQLFYFVEQLTSEDKALEWVNENVPESPELNKKYAALAVVDVSKKLHDKLNFATMKRIYPIGGTFYYEEMPRTIQKGGGCTQHYKIIARPFPESINIAYINVSKVVYEVLIDRHLYIKLSRNGEAIDTQLSEAKKIAQFLSFALYGVYDVLDVRYSHCIIE